MIYQQPLLGHPPNTVLLSGKRVSVDIKSFKVGIFDEIREDVRRFSSVQPVDEVLLERVEAGWEGILYSKRDAFLFVFNSAGFVAKPVSGSDSKVMQYAYRLIDKEGAATRAVRKRKAQEEQLVLNAKHSTPSTNQAGDLGEGTASEKRFTGPPTNDAIRRDLAQARPIIPTQAASTDASLAAGGVITNKEGKLLIVKPKNGYGGYEWTFPKGGLEPEEYRSFGADGVGDAARREVFEETGYSVEIDRFLAKISHDDGGTCYYFSMVLDEEALVHSTDDEIAEMKWVSAHEALELLHEDDDIRVLSLATAKTPRLIIKADKLPGGLADDKTNKDFDKKQLAAGIKVEKEHTTDASLAAEIARDHLTEDPQYYVKLKQIEKRLAPPDLVKASKHTGVMIALFLPRDLAEELAQPGGEPASSMHVTLAYLGKNLTKKMITKVREVVKSVAEMTPYIVGSLAGLGRFSASASSEGKDVIYISVDSPSLTSFRQLLVTKLGEIGVPADITHGYTPHVTLKYVPTKSTPTLKHFEPVPVAFSTISVAAGDVQEHFKLGASEPKLMVKALPKQSKATKEAKNKKQGAKPIAAASKKAGAGGKTRYNYPGEKKVKPPPEPKAEPHEGGHQAPDERPSTEMDPIVVPKDGKHKDPPKHTVDLAPLLTATKMDRNKWEAVAKRFASEQMGKRRGFVEYMQTHLKDLTSKYSLDADYFGLVYDVLTGANPGIKPPTAKT